MRLRVTEKLTGSIDGIRLDRFSPGYVYDVGPSLASYLFALGAAVPVADDAPALILPLDQRMFGGPPAATDRRVSSVTTSLRAKVAERRRKKG